MLMEKKLDFEINTSVGDYSTDCEFCDTARPMPAVEKNFDAQIKIQKIFIFSEEQDKLKNIKEFLKKRHDITITRGMQIVATSKFVSAWLISEEKMIKRTESSE